MKILTSLLFASFLSTSAFGGSWTTEKLNDAELQAIDEATQKEIKELSNCMSDTNETEIAETSCINEVFGDVHN